jgi:hypothetical protein
MTRSREDAPFEKVEPDAISVRFVGRDKDRLVLIAKAKGLPKAALVRMWALEGIARSLRDENLLDNLSSSDFSPLGDA